MSSTLTHLLGVKSPCSCFVIVSYWQTPTGIWRRTARRWRKSAGRPCCTQAPGEQFSQANLAPVKHPSRDQRLLRDHESADEEEDETRSGNEEKKEPRGHKQKAANNQECPLNRTAACAMTASELLLKTLSRVSRFETSPGLLELFPHCG